MSKRLGGIKGCKVFLVLIVFYNKIACRAFGLKFFIRKHVRSILVLVLSV